MRLLSHNFLACLKCDSYPLKIDAAEVEDLDVPMDSAFVRSMLARIDYPSLVAEYHRLRAAHASVREHGGELPETMEGQDVSGDDSSFLQTANYAMNVVAVKRGTLQCPNCATSYPINEFIPNFVLEK